MDKKINLSIVRKTKTHKKCNYCIDTICKNIYSSKMNQTCPHLELQKLCSDYSPKTRFDLYKRKCKICEEYFFTPFKKGRVCNPCREKNKLRGRNENRIQLVKELAQKFKEFGVNSKLEYKKTTRLLRLKLFKGEEQNE